MNKAFILLFPLAFCINSLAQTSQSIRFFKNESLTKEVVKEKAFFSETVTTMPDGTITTEVKDLRQNLIIRSNSLKGDEPVGIWVVRYSSGSTQTLDYSFELVYTDKKCEKGLSDTTVIIGDYFSDLDSIGYVAPKLKSAQKTIASFLVTRVFYPSYAMQRNLQGTSYIKFIINTQGNVEDIKVCKSSHIALDKEAVRVIRQLEFSNPAMLNGKPQQICIMLPVKFTLN